MTDVGVFLVKVFGVDFIALAVLVLKGLTGVDFRFFDADPLLPEKRRPLFLESECTDFLDIDDILSGSAM